MLFEFDCQVCHAVVNVKGRIGHVPRAPLHCGKRAKRRFSAPEFSVGWGWADYANRAYLGDESVPGMTTQDARATIDSMKVRD